MPSVSLTDPLVSAARRILVLGVTGSGKSTLARAIGGVHCVPAYEVDAIAWQPGWVKAADSDLVREVAAITAGDGWVLDSLWGVTRPVVLPRVELVVGLDLPWRVSAGRLLSRTWGRLVTGDPICGENVESWSQVLSRDSILLWHARSFREKRREQRAWEHDPDLPPILRLTSTTQVDTLLHLLASRTGKERQ